jgi:hypothetical protein
MRAQFDEEERQYWAERERSSDAAESEKPSASS